MARHVDLDIFALSMVLGGVRRRLYLREYDLRDGLCPVGGVAWVETEGTATHQGARGDKLSQEGGRAVDMAGYGMSFGPRL